MKNRAISYLASVLTGGVVQASILRHGFAWPGFQWEVFLISAFVSSISNALFAWPAFIMACLLSDRLRSRNPVIFCGVAVISGALWLFFNVLIFGPDESGAVNRIYFGALPSNLIAAAAAGLMQWLVSENGRPLPA